MITGGIVWVIPLRPITSSRNFFCHPLAKFLLDIINHIEMEIIQQNVI